MIGLNPYSNGICFMSIASLRYLATASCLNPYSNGICFMSGAALTLERELHTVLILILMEYAL